MTISNRAFLSGLDGLVDCPGAVEAAASQPPGSVDGGELHFSLPHHDGGDDVLPTSAVPLLLQR